MNYQLIKTEEALRKAIESISAHQVVGLDTETTELDPYVGRLRLVQLATPSGVYIIDLDAFNDGDLRSRRRSPRCAICSQLLVRSRSLTTPSLTRNSSSTISGADLNGVFDTLLASQLVSAGDIEERHGLDTVASRYLNESVDKTERLSNWNFELSEAQLEYAARDAAILIPLPREVV